MTEASAAVWFALPEEAWQEAFDSHPRIGEKHAQTTQPPSLCSGLHKNNAQRYLRTSQPNSPLKKQTAATSRSLAESSSSVRQEKHLAKFSPSWKRECKTTPRQSFAKQPNNNVRSHSFAFNVGWSPINDGHIHTHPRHSIRPTSRRCSNRTRPYDEQRVVPDQRCDDRCRTAVASICCRQRKAYSLAHIAFTSKQPSTTNSIS